MLLHADPAQAAHSVLPGFDLALGFTLLYISLIVLVPLSAAFLKTASRCPGRQFLGCHDVHRG